MSNETANRLGATILRISLGVMYLTHGLVLKVFTYGFAGTAAYFESIALRAAFAHVVIVAEALGGLLLVLDVHPRWVAAGLLPVLLGATWAHAGNGWVFSNPGGGWEYPLFLIVVSVVVTLQAPVAEQVHAATARRYGEAARAASLSPAVEASAIRQRMVTAPSGRHRARAATLLPRRATSLGGVAGAANVNR